LSEVIFRDVNVEQGRKIRPKSQSGCYAPWKYCEAMMCTTQKRRQAPLVQISGVKLLGEVGAETEVEIRLSLNPSRTTAIRDWRLEFAVSYADGATYQVKSGESRLPPEKLICLVPTRSDRGGGAALIGYEAKLAVSFNTISSIILHKDFAMPRPLDGAREHSGATRKGRIAILDACPVQDGASDPGAMRGIDVRWVADAPARAVINRFDLELKATHADGTIRRICKTVSGAQRQARLALASAGSEITSIKAGLGATFTWFGSATAAKVGSFHA
jgi:hypothetical protein